MRILHTSDWHLGRSFHREGMLTHQAAYVDHLIEVVETEGVDLVVVAGDVYDRALPPVDAVRLANDTFTRLKRSRATTVVTSGNHDSAQRLGFGAELIDASGVHLRTRADGVGRPVVLHDEHGEVAVHALPYLDPDAVASAWELTSRSHEATLRAAMTRVRRDLAGRRARSIVLAHAFVAGGLPSDSERDISVGGVSLVPAEVFDGVDYVALGHLHGRQQVTETIRYSGSPLAYSFSEAAQVKGSWLVDLGPDGVTATTIVPAPVPRRLGRLRGTVEELLTDPRLCVHEDSWVQATLTDEVRPRAAKERLSRRFPHLLVLGFEPEGGDATAGAVPGTRATTESDHEVALRFVADLRGAPASPEESRLLLEACEACCDDRELDLTETLTETLAGAP